MDGEAQAKQHELREAFESDCADLLAEIAEAAQKEKEDAIRHLLMDFKVCACVYECALCHGTDTSAMQATKEKHVAELKHALQVERDTKARGTRLVTCLLWPSSRIALFRSPTSSSSSTRGCPPRFQNWSSL